MEEVSRRKLIAATVAVPITAGAAVANASGLPDPNIAKVAAWITLNNEREAMIRKWQGLESLLFDHARVMKIACDVAGRSNIPEARAMRALDRRIDAAWSQLGCIADQVRVARATSAWGAIAKLELGLAVQGPFDWQDNALELLRDGLAQLRTFTVVSSR